MDVGFLQLLFCTGSSTVGLELDTVMYILEEMPSALGAVCDVIRSFHTHIVILGFPDFPANLPADCGGRRIGDFELGGRLFLDILKMELHFDFSVAVVGNQFRLDHLLCGDFCL